MIDLFNPTLTEGRAIYPQRCPKPLLIGHFFLNIAIEDTEDYSNIGLVYLFKISKRMKSKKA